LEVLVEPAVRRLARSLHLMELVFVACERLLERLDEGSDRLLPLCEVPLGFSLNPFERGFREGEEGFVVALQGVTRQRSERLCQLLSSLRQKIFLFMQAFHSLVASRLGDRNLRAEACDGPEPGQHSAEEEAGHQAEGESCHVHHLNPCLTRVRALCTWISWKGYGNLSRSSRKQEGHPIC